MFLRKEHHDLSTSRKTPRLAAVLATAVGLLLAFAALGGVGIAQAGGGPGKAQYGKKVMVCHKGKRTIRVSKHAVAKHLAHGDTLGRCDRNHRKGWKHKAHKGDKAHQGEKGKEYGAKGHKGEKDKEYGAKKGGGEKGKRGGKG
jgi:hypothetical protein